ncbi:MAG TPA: regulatory protein RecX [Acidobacteriaceae bacterium]|nr:regulatory protein RecX [Acidobacteriaceae bacterium]
MRGPRKPPVPLDEDALYNYAVKLLGQQMRTVAELKRLLRRRIPPGEEGQERLERVAARLKEQRYLDDSGYAQDYAKLRQENSSFGRRRVQQDLMRKGVHSEVIAKTLDAAYEGVGEEELARRHLERKRICKPANDKEAARVARMLMRAGFSTGTIVRILKKWDVGDEAVLAIETADTDERESES